MDRAEALAIIKSKRQEKKMTFQALGKAVGRNPVYVAAALNGQQRLGPEEAGKLAKALGLASGVAEAVSAFPIRTDFPITTDPFKYRLMEIVGVYGDSLRDMANEMFGDGIMSAIDFTLDMEKVTGSQGEARVKITLNGKWLPYKEF
ncbi:MAG: cyanase [Nitrospirae bacterium]|nr:MAG: cyanase [Nitrospirota bacterium]